MRCHSVILRAYKEGTALLSLPVLFHAYSSQLTHQQRVELLLALHSVQQASLEQSASNQA